MRTAPVALLLAALIAGCATVGEDGTDAGMVPADTAIDAAPPAFCGDGTCGVSETCASCTDDCGTCPDSCGDGTCDPEETCTECPLDCGGCTPFCGDGKCNGLETCAGCFADCGMCPAGCGDGTCDSGEDCVNCATDCGGCPPGCGDGSCNGTETCTSCPGDCGTCPPMCGDGTCDASESCSSCAADCGGCPPVCGDGTCDAGEDCASCTADCGSCGCTADANEPNDSSSSATPVVSGVTYCGLSICAGDVDWLGFTVSSGFTASITFSHAQGDLELEIYSGITAAYVTGSYSGTDDETVMLTGLASGTYWARVYEAFSAENPSYCFDVTTF